VSRPAARPARVRVTARAKLNLALAVGPLGADGYHELTTVFQSVSLADTLIAEPARRFSLEVRHENAAARGRLRGEALGRVRNSDNLVLRAARAFVARHGGSPARFLLIKRIPARAGMGGGSADAAAALAAMEALSGVRPPASERLRLAMDLGADVPFARLGGTALGRGRGERLSPLRLDRPFRAIVAVPAWTISTREAFAVLDHGKKILTPGARPLGFAQSIARKRVSALALTRLGNTFEHALGRREAAFLDLCARLRTAGLHEPRLTGSGSAVFGLLEPGVPARRVLERITGREALFVVRSTRRAVDVERIPVSSRRHG
jgi:4-diphosphocytidyl-2-C-methyl-D-erythritol kinase